MSKRTASIEGKQLIDLSWGALLSRGLLVIVLIYLLESSSKKSLRFRKIYPPSILQ